MIVLLVLIAIAVGSVICLYWYYPHFMGCRYYYHEIEFERFPEIKPSDRILIIAPHPDDETLGTGGAIATALEAKAQVMVVVVVVMQEKARMLCSGGS